MFIIERLLFQYSTDIAKEGDPLGYSRERTGVCERVYKQHPAPLLTQLSAGDSA
jgi:hypothetical protein